MTPVPLPVRDWFRAAPAAYARPDHVPRAETVSRFNDGGGTYAVFYCAADAVTALLEARALFGYPHSSEVEATHNTWRVFRYRIDLGQEPTIVNLGSPRERSAANTNAQELTGDWQGRRLVLGNRRGIEHVRYSTAQVPTQRLGERPASRTRSPAPGGSGTATASPRSPPASRSPTSPRSWGTRCSRRPRSTPPRLGRKRAIS